MSTLFSVLSIGASLYCLYLLKTFDTRLDEDEKFLDETYGPRPDNRLVAGESLIASIKFILVIAMASGLAALLLLWR